MMQVFFSPKEETRRREFCSEDEEVVVSLSFLDLIFVGTGTTLLGRGRGGSCL
jgi:hypothetical protein